MKYLKQFGLILLVSFIGELMNMFIPLPVPASIWGLVITLISTVAVMAVSGCVTQLVIRTERKKKGNE